MPGGFPDLKRTFLVKATKQGVRVYVDAYTKEQAVRIMQREGVCQRLSKADKMKEADEIIEEVREENAPLVLDDFFSHDPKKFFLLKIKPEDIKRIEQREVYVRTSAGKEGVMRGLSWSGGLKLLLIVPNFVIEEVREENIPIMLDDPRSGTDPTKKGKKGEINGGGRRIIYLSGQGGLTIRFVWQKICHTTNRRITNGYQEDRNGKSFDGS